MVTLLLQFHAQRDGDNNLFDEYSQRQAQCVNFSYTSDITRMRRWQYVEIVDVRQSGAGNSELRNQRGGGLRMTFSTVSPIHLYPQVT